jgi:MFS family permease
MQVSSMEIAAEQYQPVSLVDRDEQLYRKIAIRFLPLLFVCYFVSYLDRVNIGFAKLQMLGDLGFSDAIYAAGASIFFWGYIAFEVPSNILLHKLGARLWIARIMVTWGIASMALAFTAPIAAALHLPKEHVFYALRFALGICEAGFFPGIILYMSYWFPAAKQSRVMAVFISAIPISLVVGGPTSGALMEYMGGVLQLNGWQWMIVLEGIPAVLLGICVALWLDSSVDNAIWLTAAEKTTVKANLDATDAHRTGHLGKALSDWRVWTLAGIMLAYNVGLYGLSFWLPTIISHAGYKGPLQVGLLSAIPWLVSTVVMVFNAFHSRKNDERRWHAAVPALIAGFALLGSAATAGNFSVSFICLIVSASGIMALTPIFFTFPATILSGTAAAAGIAFITSIGSLSGILGSFIGSLAKEWTGDVNNGTYVLGAFLLLAGTLVLSLPRNVLASSQS